MTEPTPHRDTGPYRDGDQARAQFEASAWGIRTDPQHLTVIAFYEALTIAGVSTTPYERATLAALAVVAGPETCQVINGWVLRAYLAGAAERDFEASGVPAAQTAAAAPVGP